MAEQTVANQRPRPERPHFSIVVPLFNEEECVGELITRLTEVMSEHDYEIILVNDGSTDGTLGAIQEHALQDSRIKFLSFSRNFGHQMALSAGIDHARGDAVITLDGDLQHPPELIPTLIERWRAGTDVVSTVRVSNRGHRLKELISSVFYWTLRKLSGVDISAGSADFRLLDRAAADAIRSCNEHFIFIRGLVPWLGFSRESIPYEAAARYGGSSKYLTARMAGFALDGIFSFSVVPLRVISLLGLLTIILGAVYGTYSLLVRIFTNQAVSGWTSLVIVILVFSGTQLLSLGILSEYVGRIYEEVKHRPRYIVSQRSSGLEAQTER